jgi:hypothetical protein
MVGKYALILRTTTLSITDTTSSYGVSYDTISLYNGVIYDTGNPTRVMVTTEGVYLFLFQGIWFKSGGGTAVGRVWFRLNGSDISETATTNYVNSTAYMTFTVQWMYSMTTTDYIEVYISGTSTNLSMPILSSATGPTSPTGASVTLTVHRVG